MTGLNSLGWQIHDHLKTYRPKMFQALKRQGKLKQTVEAMQNKASSTMAFLEERGVVTSRGLGDREGRRTPAERGGRAQPRPESIAVYRCDQAGGSCATSFVQVDPFGFRNVTGITGCLVSPSGMMLVRPVGFTTTATLGYW